MDEATIKQMMQEYKQAIDKAVFLREEIRYAVLCLGKNVTSEYMSAYIIHSSDNQFPDDILLD